MNSNEVVKYYNWFRESYPVLNTFQLEAGYGGFWYFTRHLTDGMVQQISLGVVDSIVTAEGKRARALVLAFPSGALMVNIPAFKALNRVYGSAIAGVDMGHGDEREPLAGDFFWEPPLSARLPAKVYIAAKQDVKTHREFLDTYISTTVGAADRLTTLGAMYNDLEVRYMSEAPLKRLLFKVLVKAPDFRAYVNFYIWLIEQSVDEQEFYLGKLMEDGIETGQPIADDRAKTQLEVDRARDALSRILAVKDALEQEWENASPIWSDAGQYVVGQYAGGERQRLEQILRDCPAERAELEQGLRDPDAAWPGITEERRRKKMSGFQRRLFNNRLRTAWSEIKLARLLALDADAGKESSAPTEEHDVTPPSIL